MNLDQYKKNREARLLQEKKPRETCSKCRKPQVTCYCVHIKPFASSPPFVILIHHDEYRRSVATGRMAHLCLSNSFFFEGTDFSYHEDFNDVLSNKDHFPVLLYPGPNAVDLSALCPSERRTYFPQEKKLVVVLIDGTWAQARKVKRLSKNLSTLPQFSFSPTSPSAFRVRKQPKTHCYSTIEAIHQFIQLMNGVDRASGNLLDVFSVMVSQQIEYGKTEAKVRYRRRPAH